MSRVSLPRPRFEALVRAASKVGCICPNPANREHDGKCIGCWALAKRVEHIRNLETERERLGLQPVQTLARILEECEEEQQFRAKEIPAAERRFKAAREAEEKASEGVSDGDE